MLTSLNFEVSKFGSTKLACLPNKLHKFECQHLVISNLHVHANMTL